MTRSTLWPQNRKPSPDDIAEFVDNPLWKTLCSWLESGYRTVPRIEYSRCGMAPVLLFKKNEKTFQKE